MSYWGPSLKTNPTPSESGRADIAEPEKGPSQNGDHTHPATNLTDCAICSVAMVLGVPYETVQHDHQERYDHLDEKTAWWEHYPSWG